MKLDRLAEVPSKKATVPTKRDAARPARRKTNAKTLIGTNSKAFVWRRYHMCLNCERERRIFPGLSASIHLYKHIAACLLQQIACA